MPSSSVCFSHSTALHLARSAQAYGFETPCPDTSHALAPSTRKSSAERASLEIDRLFGDTAPPMPRHFLAALPQHYTAEDSVRPHKTVTPLPRKSVMRLSEHVCFASPELAFMQEASLSRDWFALLQLCFELCGTYQTKSTAPMNGYQVPALTSVSSLRSFANRNHSLRGARRVLRLLPYVADASASPRETQLALLLGLPTRYGGYGLGMPHMNYELETTEAARSLTGKWSFRCDLCWPAAKLDVEYQSTEMHSGEVQRLSDSRRAHALEAMGWQTVWITNNELLSCNAMDTIATTLFKKIGKRQRKAVANHWELKLRLREELGLL